MKYEYILSENTIGLSSLEKLVAMSILKYSESRKETRNKFIENVSSWTNLTRKTIESILYKFETKGIVSENGNYLYFKINDASVKFSFSATAKDGYKKYLKSDHWKKTREKFLKLRNYTCEECNKRGGLLHCHHLNYNNLWKEKDEDIKVVCDKCHKILHR